MKNTDFMNLSLPEGTDKIDIEILNNDFKKLESEASKHYIKQQIEVDGTATIIGSIGPYVQLENLTDNILNVSIGDELVVLMKGDNRKIRTISGENYGVVTNGAVRITYYINARTYADENFYKKEKVDELLQNVEATVEVDAELSETSENPVQNKVITAEFANYATTAEVENKITEKVAEIVAGAPEDFDTLKEMSDWLNQHEDSAAAMNSAIQKNAADITTANTAIEKNAEDIANATLGQAATGTIVSLADLQGSVPFSEIKVNGEDIANNEVTLKVHGKNLLFNSDFTNVINTRGFDEYINNETNSSKILTIDGWYSWLNTGEKIIINSNSIALFSDDTLNVTNKPRADLRCVLTNINNVTGLRNKVATLTLNHGQFSETAKPQMFLRCCPDGGEYTNLFMIGLSVSGQTSHTFKFTSDVSYIEVGIWSYGTLDLYNMQLELGDTATYYEPYHCYAKTFTPTGNTFALTENLEQYEGTNTLIVSAGELSVVGARKNATIKRVYNTTSTLAENIETANENIQKNVDDITAVKNSIAINKSTLGIQCKNLLKPATISQGETKGITITVNDDGTITATGTATETFSINVGTVNLKAGNYILNGCPPGGSNTTYRIDTFYDAASHHHDLGNGVKVNLSSDTNITVRLVIYPAAGEVNLTIAPMIVYADVLDRTYEPYQADVNTRVLALETLSDAVYKYHKSSYCTIDGYVLRVGNQVHLNLTATFRTACGEWYGGIIGLPFKTKTPDNSTRYTIKQTQSDGRETSIYLQMGGTSFYSSTTFKKGDIITIPPMILDMYVEATATTTEGGE